jgi:simple sugar transport system ATP-binding protein
LTEAGLSVIFISHKLQEVMAVSDRVVVLRHGKVVANVFTAETTPEKLAELMVGQPLPKTSREPMAIGKPVLELESVTVHSSGNRNLIESVDLTIYEHEIVGIAGVSGNGQAALFDLLSGLAFPSQGKMRLYGREIHQASPSAMVEAGVARIPEDRHRVGLIPDMSIWENLILETHSEPAFSKAGFLKLDAANRHAIALIEAFDVRCSSPHAVVRLLSGGNMQKLILGRVLSRNPKLIVASQPTRGLDLGAVTYVHQQLLEARARGAGILLISEDLEELLSLSDRVGVIYKGNLSKPLPPGEISVRQIGLMMAGRGEF